MSILSLSKINKDTLRFEQICSLLQDKRAKRGGVTDIPQNMKEQYGDIS